MSFAVRWTTEAQHTFEQLQAAAHRTAATRTKTKKAKTSKQEGLHPGLQTHEFHSLPHPYHADAKVFEAYAQHKTPGAYRVFWCYGPRRSEITIIAITPHP